MYQKIYASGAVEGTDHETITRILETSRRNNSALGLTGILMYAHGTFLQLLEGERAAVERVFAAISRDTRHRNVIPLVSRDVPGRAFGEWSMGFRELNAAIANDAAVFELSREAVARRMMPNTDMTLRVLTAFTGQQFFPATEYAASPS